MKLWGSKLYNSRQADSRQLGHPEASDELAKFLRDRPELAPLLQIEVEVIGTDDGMDGLTGAYRGTA